MKIGIIKIEDRDLTSDINNFAFQWSENLSMQIEFLDKTWDGYSLMFLYAHDYEMKKTGVCDYDPSTKLLMLPLGAFEKSGKLYLSLYGIKANERLSSGCIAFNVNISGNPNATNIPREPDWIDVAQGYMDQLFANEYQQPLQDLMDQVSKLIKDTKAEIKGLSDSYTTNINKLIKQYNDDRTLIINDTTSKVDALKKNAETEITTLRNQVSVMVSDVEARCKTIIDKATLDIDGLKTGYATYVNDIQAQLTTFKAQVLKELDTNIASIKASANTAIDTMLKNATTDFKSLKDATSTEINALKTQAQAQQTQIDAAKQSMSALQADLIAKRDNGFFDGADGASIPASGFFTLFKRDGHLIVRYLKGSSPPPLVHKNGRLYYKKVKEV